MDSDRTDEELMSQYLEGDEEAFEALYKRYAPRIYGFLNKRMLDSNAADDVFQMVFHKLHKSRENYDPKLSLSAWIFTIARNASVDYMRRNPQRFTQLKPEHEELIHTTELRNTATEIDTSGLTENKERAIHLRYYEDLEFDEIASRLKVSSSNARQLVSRAIRELKAKLGKAMFLGLMALAATLF